MSNKNQNKDDSAGRKKLIGDDYPYPMTAPGVIKDRHGHSKVMRYLGVLQRPMTVFSERNKDDITGILHRKMPMPGMLDMMYKVFSLLDPRNERRAIMVKGQPGAGKTFLGELAGEISSQKGAIKVDCTGLNLMELFFETVLDFKGNQRFYDQLDEKIKKYNDAVNVKDIRDSILNPRSVEILRDSLGEAFAQDDDGKISINWERANRSHKDEKGDYLSSRECSEIVRKGLQEVADKEGLNAGNGNTLGMATQRGPAWRAFEEGRILLLDELNRAKKGTFGVMHGFLQLTIGEGSPLCTVNNPLKEKGDRTNENIVFDRSKMGSGFLVYMTGNTEDDSDEVLELPEALSSRIIQLQVPKLTAKDWQHRFCQMLTGMPVSTEFEAQRDVWERDPAQFKKFLVDMRTKGENREIPAHHMALLRRKWPDVIEASERFARFMEGASVAVDPNSASYRTASDLTQLLDEINDVFKRETSIDLRKITFFLNEAFLDKPVVRPPAAGPNITPLINSEDMPDRPEEIQQSLGTHMSYAIIDWIVSVSFSRGKDKLGNRLMQLASECGIVPSEMQEALASDKRSFADLLNDNPYTSNDADVRAGVAREILCDYWRKNASVTTRDDDLVTAGAVRALIEDIDNGDIEEGAPAEAVIFGDDPSDTPLQLVQVLDSAVGANREQGKDPAPGLDALSSRTALLFSLAAPAVRDLNMDVLWTKSFSHASGLVPEGPGLAAKDQALAMAEGTADSGLCVTTLLTSEKSRDGSLKESPMHVVWNSKNQKILVVGDGAAPERLAKIFNRAGGAYVDRNRPDAEAAVDKALDRVMGNSRADNESALKTAFLMRVSATPGEDETTARLSALMTKKETIVQLPVYITSRPAPDKP